MSDDRCWTPVPGAAPAEGETRNVRVAGRGLVIARCEGNLQAVEDRCSHDDGPLGEGRLEGCAIICPRHGARFDVRDGAVLRMPAIAPIRAVPVREVDGRVEVDVEDL